jgi:siroheme decarboxylase
LTRLQQQIIKKTQRGLHLVKKPYARLADELDVDEDILIKEMSSMLYSGQIRRIGVVPNHYNLGIVANGMSVWNIQDNKVDKFGEYLASLDFVSHAYLRPRHKEIWPYNIFAMVHGTKRKQVVDEVTKIAKKFNLKKDKYEILFSTKILKKTGMRL